MTNAKKVYGIYKVYGSRRTYRTEVVSNLKDQERFFHRNCYGAEI